MKVQSTRLSSHNLANSNKPNLIYNKKPSARIFVNEAENMTFGSSTTVGGKTHNPTTFPNNGLSDFSPIMPRKNNDENPNLSSFFHSEDTISNPKSNASHPTKVSFTSKHLL